MQRRSRTRRHRHPEAAITDAFELVAAALAGIASQIGLLPAPRPRPTRR
jgi:hypothetical protein